MSQEIILSIVWFIIYVVLFVIALVYRNRWNKARNYNTELIMNRIDVRKRTQALLAAKILEGLDADLPSSYYEAIENKNLEEVADIVINRIKNTKIQKDE